MRHEDIAAIKELLATPVPVAIIPHRSPDGDAMGSTLGLCHFLKKLGHSPTVVSPNDFPGNLAWLPGSEEVMIFERDKSAATSVIEQAKIIFILDFNAFHRTGDMEHVLAKVSTPVIMIDHHQRPDPCATYTYSDTSFGSTCEMLYNFIGYLGKTHVIDKTIATCIYTGIVTDSGSFRFPSTTSKTHRVVADLIEVGVENSDVHIRLFDNNSFDSLQLLGRALSKLKIIASGRVSYTMLTQEELDSHHYVKGDTEGVVNYGLSIKGVIFTAIFIEHADENIIKISFRSKGNFDVNSFARAHFDGGGHINAAGGKSKMSMEETVSKFEDIIAQISFNEHAE